MKSVLTQIKGASLALTLVAAAAGSQAAVVGQPVTIQEDAIAGAASHSFVADQLSGQYDEVLTILNATQFSTEAIFNAGGWFSNGIAQSTQVNGFGASGYGLYAKFTGFGTYAPNGSGGFNFVGGSGAIEIWADANQDTNYDVALTTAGAVPSVSNLVNVGGAATITDDVLLGTANLITAAQGQTASGLANGNFELVFGDFALANPDGLAYFTAPRPFYLVLDLNGNFQSFTPSIGSSVQLLGSSANAFFNKAPEPGALALVSLALLGMSAAMRRNRK